ncbi:hypothetical protein HaLaN_32479, partial [Haematococcus lacustris]
MERMLAGDETKLQVQGTLDLTVARAQNNYSLAARLQDLGKRVRASISWAVLLHMSMTMRQLRSAVGWTSVSLSSMA